ncbi:hypothetical protein BT63DRAFT_208473 [Microthyrium microscopicum]|uniref:Uncharacterized protein n=1 Tax=Microthyrium microscopicum TaxID=703497 RepID=A0A6A6UI10_9PEZI|nr:hypothetical protein BT63DRAFT_208473 [Microthyrium microscopicum]
MGRVRSSCNLILINLKHEGRDYPATAYDIQCAKSRRSLCRIYKYSDYRPSWYFCSRLRNRDAPKGTHIWWSETFMAERCTFLISEQTWNHGYLNILEGTAKDAGPGQVFWANNDQTKFAPWSDRYVESSKTMEIRIMLRSMAPGVSGFREHDAEVLPWLEHFQKQGEGKHHLNESHTKALIERIEKNALSYTIDGIVPTDARSGSTVTADVSGNGSDTHVLSDAMSKEENHPKTPRDDSASTKETNDHALTDWMCRDMLDVLTIIGQSIAHYDLERSRPTDRAGKYKLVHYGKIKYSEFKEWQKWQAENPTPKEPYEVQFGVPIYSRELPLSLRFILKVPKSEKPKSEESKSEEPLVKQNN